jgi:polyisoprenoid-binding protein YceI
MKRTLWLVLVLLLIQAGSARADRFAVSPGKPNLVKFVSNATLESFEGKTNQARGSFSFNPDHLGDSVEVMVEVDLTTLSTGIKLRDQHMYTEHLETSKYPKAIFRGGRIREATAAALPPGSKVSFVIDGTFELHGVTNPVKIPIEVERSAAGASAGLHVLGHFDVKLADYKISRPQFLVMKLNEVQKVTVDLSAAPAP